MNKRLLAVAVAGGLGWYAWRVFNQYDETRFDIQSDEGNFLMASLKVATSDISGAFMESPNANLTPSMALINFTKMYEEFRAYPYYATDEEKRLGKQTVGYGHVILKGETFTYPMTKEFANQLFLKDLNKHIAKIYTKIKVKLNQNQFDALCDFSFNAGSNALNVYYALTDLINAGKFSEAADRFMSYTTQGGEVVPGLMNRRYSEMNMFRFGKYERYTGFTG